MESEIQGRWLGGSLQVARPGGTMGPREGCGGDESDMTGVTQLPPKLPREETKPGNHFSFIFFCCCYLFFVFVF